MAELELYTGGSADWDRFTLLADAWLRGFNADALQDEHNTVKSYKRDITLFFNWCRRHHRDPREVRRAEMKIWLAERQTTIDPETSAAWADDSVRNRGRAPRPDSGTTARRRLASVSSWYAFCQREEVPGFVRNPADIDAREKPPNDSRHTSSLLAEHVKPLLEEADGDGPLAAAIVWLLFDTGIRAGTLINAMLTDLGHHEGDPALEVKIKGGKRVKVPLPPASHRRLLAYLATRASNDRTLVVKTSAARSSAARLIVAPRGGKLYVAFVIRLLQRLAAQAGLGQEIIATLTGHVTRATYIVLHLDAGIPLRKVQLAVAHARPDTTAGYDARRQFRKGEHPSFVDVYGTTPPAGQVGTDELLRQLRDAAGNAGSAEAAGLAAAIELVEGLNTKP